MIADLQYNFNKITMVSTNAVWQKYIYKTEEMNPPQDLLDCSFYCKNIEQMQACDVFAFEVVSTHFSVQCT